MIDIITITDIIITDQPRISSVKLGEALGYKSNQQMNTVIKRNMEEIATYAIVTQTEGKTTLDPQGRGRTSVAYLLTEHQALVIAMLSRTEEAKQIRAAMIRAFIELRQIKVKQQDAAISAVETSVKALQQGRRHGDQLHDLGVLKAKMHAIIDQCRHSSDLSLYEELVRTFPGYIVPDIEMVSKMRKIANDQRDAKDERYR